MAPNPLDFSKVFTGFKEAFQTGNVVVLFTILTLLVVYALLAVWAWRRDRLDYMQVGTPLLINKHYHFPVSFSNLLTSALISRSARKLGTYVIHVRRN